MSFLIKFYLSFHIFFFDTFEGNASNDRRNISYNRLKTHDKSDCLSSSNPNLLDLLAPHQTNNNEEDDYEDEFNTRTTISTSQTMSSSTSPSTSSSKFSSSDRRRQPSSAAY